jgi:hypothetical protein
MAVEDAIVALREHWDDVISRLGPAKGEEVRGLIGRLGGPDHKGAVNRIADILVGELPREHPVRRALSQGYLFAPPVVDWASITLALQDVAVVRPFDSDPPPVQQVLHNIIERLLSGPAFTEEEVTRHGADPADPDLIWLNRPDGSRQWPKFQFGPDGPLPVVRTINRLLGVAADPAGVADWWLSRNGWLDGRPSQLLGEVPDELLVSAARAVGSEL